MARCFRELHVASIDHAARGNATRNARRAVTGLEPKRADVIIAGAIIVEAVLDRLGARARPWCPIAAFVGGSPNRSRAGPANDRVRARPDDAGPPLT